MTKKLSAFLCASLALGCAAHNGANGKNLFAEPFTAEQAEVKQVLQGIVDAAQKKDMDRVESFHAYSPKFTKFENDGLGRQDAEAARKGERALVDMKAVAIQIEDLKVDVYGLAAIATGIQDYDVDTGAGKVTGKDRFTIVFVKLDGAWKIVHEHASPLAPVPAPH